MAQDNPDLDVDFDSLREKPSFLDSQLNRFFPLKNEAESFVLDPDELTKKNQADKESSLFGSNEVGSTKPQKLVDPENRGSTDISKILEGIAKKPLV